MYLKIFNSTCIAGGLLSLKATTIITNSNYNLTLVYYSHTSKSDVYKKFYGFCIFAFNYYLDKPKSLVIF